MRATFDRPRLSAMSVVVALAACSDFDPGSRVTDFRLIAVSADKPYAAPGETVQLSTLHHEPFGRPITWAWTTCPLPQESTVNGCLSRLAELARSPGRAPPSFAVGRELGSFAVTIPPNVLDGVAPAARGNALVGVVTVACPGELSVKDLARLGPGELPFRCVEAGSELELSYERYAVAVKRIYIYDRDRNQDPAITGLTWDGTPWVENDIKDVGACDFDSNAFGECAGEKHEIAASAPPETREAGTNQFGTPYREDVVIQYYASEGLFEFGTKTLDDPKTRWAARSQARGQTVDMWFVLRDNRGGVGWTTRRVRVR
jgi:hypothetical protein